MKKIRKGDEVVVIIGKDRGRRGRVERVLDNDTVIVEGLNIAKKHQRPNPQLGVAGGIIEKEMPIHISNLALWNPGKGKDGGPDRVGLKWVGEGEQKRKVRVFKSNGETVDR